MRSLLLKVDIRQVRLNIFHPKEAEIVGEFLLLFLSLLPVWRITEYEIAFHKCLQGISTAMFRSQEADVFLTISRIAENGIKQPVELVFNASRPPDWLLPP